MSRIGQNPVTVPSDVTVDIAGQMVTAKGKLGELSLNLVDDVQITREDDKLWLKPRGTSKRARTMWGTSRSLVQNIVTGVGAGFTIRMEIIGVVTVGCCVGSGGLASAGGVALGTATTGGVALAAALLWGNAATTPRLHFCTKFSNGPSLGCAGISLFGTVL